MPDTSSSHGAVPLLIGHSLGGSALLHSARHIPSATAVATIATPSDPNHLGGKLSRARDKARSGGHAEVAIAVRAGRYID